MDNKTDKDVCRNVLKIKVALLSMMVVLAVCANAAIAQDKDGLEQKSEPAEESARHELNDLQTEMNLREILHVRQRLRLSPLQGSSLDNAAEKAEAFEDFARALRKVQLASPTGGPAWQSDRFDGPADPRFELATTLRRTSQSMDYQASEFEIRREFQSARRLRRLARRLRDEAKRLEKEPMEKAQSQPLKALPR